jgi:hypothetical protein
MADTVDQLASAVRFIADDPEIASLSTPLLLGSINAGWREFQRRFALKGSPIMKKTVEINLPAATTTIDTTTTPPLPEDFILPYYIEEKVQGSNDWFMEVKEREWPREAVRGSYLFNWAWQNGAINFLGATRALTIRLLYGKFFPVLVLPDDTIPIPWAIDAIKWCVLYEIALARGAPDVYRDRCDQMAERQLEQLASIHVKREQRLPRHRRSHSAGRF